jgi:hypothetical protein
VHSKFIYPKIALFIGGFLASAIAVGFGVKTILLDSHNVQFAQYKNFEYGMTMEYSNGWDKQESSVKMFPDF